MRQIDGPMKHKMTMISRVTNPTTAKRFSKNTSTPCLKRLVRLLVRRAVPGRMGRADSGRRL